MFLLLLTVASAKLLAGYPQAGRTTTPQDYWKQWVEFQKVHDRYYASHAEHSHRYGIFKDNVDRINTHNAEGHSWTMGVTPFADMTGEEFKNHTRCLNMSKKKNPIKFFDLGDNPDSVDWFEEGKVTPVKNQAQCGSCWAFSTTGAVESANAIASGKLVSLSEQELVDCSFADGNMGCNGGLMDDGFKYVHDNNGLCTEDEYPYVAKTQRLNCRSSKAKCSQRVDSISSYMDVKPNSEEQLEGAVAKGPVSIAIEADQSAFQLYNGGVFDGVCGKRLDHGVLAVGYGSEGDKKFWKVKNSWGATWGEEGFIRLCKDCDKNEGAGQCGIAAQPSYPVV